MALLALEQVPGAVLEHFETVLRKGLGVTARGLPGVESDERVRDSLREVLVYVLWFMVYVMFQRTSVILHFVRIVPYLSVNFFGIAVIW